MLVAGVQHEHVQSAEFAPRPGDDVGCERLVAQVTREAHSCAPRLAHQGERVLRVVLLLGHVRDGDVGALPREGDRDGSSDARVSARDEGAASLQTTMADVGPFAVVRFRAGLFGQARLILVLCGKALFAVRVAGVGGVVGHGSHPLRSSRAPSGG